MTREEAIKIIRKMLACTDLTVRANLNADMVSACHMAVKALEQEPTTKNDLGVDAVSRQVAIDAVRRIHPIDTDYDCTLLDKDDVMYVLNELPSVTEQEPTTKNNLAQERYQDLIEHFGDEKVAKTILESRKEFKAWLERIRWNVNRVDELDRELEQIKSTTKNGLGVDLISRADARKAIIDHQYSANFCEEHNIDHSINTGMALIALSDLPSVTPQEPKPFSIAEIKYDKDKLKELANKAVLTVTPQEPITWIVGKNNAQIAVRNMPVDKLQKICAIIGDEQEPVINKIRAEILEEKECAYADFERYKVEYLGQDWEDALDSLPQDDFRYGMERAIELIDKYKAESER